MKKILSFIILLAGVISITSCSDDDATYKALETLEVEIADVLFDVHGGEGIIKVNTTEGLEATTASKWVTLQVEGSSVKVTAEANDDLNGRSAVITLKSGHKTANVVATQTGTTIQTAVPESVIFDDKDNTMSYILSSNVDIEISVSDSWLTATLEDGKLTVAAEANTTGNIRTAHVSYKVGSLANSMSVTQGEIDKDVVGKYFIFGGVDPNAENPDDNMQMFLTQVTKNGNTYKLVFPEYNWSLPITFDMAELKMVLTAGKSMGKYTSGSTKYNVYSTLCSMASGNISYKTNVTMSAPLIEQTYTEADGTTGKVVIGNFADDGKWDGNIADSFGFGAFSSVILSDTSFKGLLALLTDVFVEQYEPKDGVSMKTKYIPVDK